MFSELRTSDFALPQGRSSEADPRVRFTPHVSRFLGAKRERRLDEFGESAEIGRAPDLVGVVVVSAGNDVEEFGWFGRLEDLSAQLDGDNVVFVAVNDQLRERELRKAIDQGEICPEQQSEGIPEQRPSDMI